MKNQLKSLLPENMKRFATKNLNEQQELILKPQDYDEVKKALTKALKLGRVNSIMFDQNNNNFGYAALISMEAISTVQGTLGPAVFVLPAMDLNKVLPS